MEKPERKTGLFARVDSVLVRVRNLEAARAWYEEKLSMRARFTAEKERLTVFDAGGQTTFTIWELKAGEAPAPRGTEGSLPVFFPAIDVADLHAMLVERGVEVEPLVRDPNGSRYFVLRDLDGNRLDVCQY